MADFCTKCSIEMFGPEVQPDIDILKIAEGLEPNTYTPVLCEGCEMGAIGKDENGNIIIGVLKPMAEGQENHEVEWVPYAEWEKNYKGLHIPDNERGHDGC